MKLPVRFIQLAFVLFCLSDVSLAQDFKSFEYRPVGPGRGGRVTTVTGTPMQPGTFYFGALRGVWM